LKLVEDGWEWLNCFDHPKKQGLLAVGKPGGLPDGQGAVMPQVG